MNNRIWSIRQSRVAANHCSFCGVSGEQLDPTKLRPWVVCVGSNYGDSAIVLDQVAALHAPTELLAILEDLNSDPALLPSAYEIAVVDASQESVVRYDTENFEEGARRGTWELGMIGLGGGTPHLLTRAKAHGFAPALAAYFSRRYKEEPYTPPVPPPPPVPTAEELRAKELAQRRERALAALTGALRIVAQENAPGVAATLLEDLVWLAGAK